LARESTVIPTERMDRQSVLRSVRRYTFALVMVQIGIGALMVWRPGPFRFGLIYTAAAVPWTLLVGLVMERNIHLLYTAEGRPLSQLNLATRVTLIRVLSIPLVSALILNGDNLMAGVVFLGAAVTDWLDGFLARRMNDVTQLGRVADPSIDAIFCGFTILALNAAGRLPIWLIVLAALRYTLLLGGAAALKLSVGYLPVRATFLGRLFYFIQYCLLMAFLSLESPGLEPWLLKGLGLVQVLVTLQLLALGRSLYRETHNEN
jgi:phosphatidylglycerophosphate synthase